MLKFYCGICVLYEQKYLYNINYFNAQKYKLSSIIKELVVIIILFRDMMYLCSVGLKVLTVYIGLHYAISKLQSLI